MAGSTPIYSFPYPESSDLVADYPALGQDLAEDVETVIAAMPPGGLVHVATQSFTTVSSVSVNDCFSSSYDTYLVKLYSQGSNTDIGFRMRLRASGTDNTTASSYYYNFLLGGSSGTPIAAASTQDFWQWAISSSEAVHDMQIYNPFLASKTNFHTVSQSGITGSTWISLLGGSHNQNTSYDGFTIYPATGTISGTIRIYGYKNS